MRIFEKGEQVEVCSNELGYVGSYYEATVIKCLGRHHRYKVKYENLIMEEDSSVPFIEVVSSNEVRPIPPEQPAGLSFRVDDVVDSLDKDGWWVGRITEQTNSNEYKVYFPTTDELIAYPASRLRKHLNWCNSNWICSKNQFWWNGYWISARKKFFLSLRQ